MHQIAWNQNLIHYLELIRRKSTNLHAIFMKSFFCIDKIYMQQVGKKTCPSLILEIGGGVIWTSAHLHVQLKTLTGILLLTDQLPAMPPHPF